MKNLSLEFTSNLFGRLKPETKALLQAVIDNPCQQTWDDAYSIILNGSNGKMITLWQSVLNVEPTYLRSKPCDENWSKIPTSETIIEAIKEAVWTDLKEQAIKKDIFLHYY